MTYVFAAAIILAVGLAIAQPLWTAHAGSEELRDSMGDGERLERERRVAILAIKEAELDHAMGKLSDEDYTSLRRIYEERALGAIEALDRVDEATAAASGGAGQTIVAAFCPGCGSAFETADRFCPSCGASRPVLSRRAF